MIKQLRRKFIWINMLLVSIVLFAVIGAFLFSNSQRLERESFAAMKQAVSLRHGEVPPQVEMGKKPPRQAPPDGSPQAEGGAASPDKRQAYYSIPVICVELDGQNQVQIVHGEENITVSGEALDKMVEMALADGGRSGRLAEYSARFLVEQTPNGTKIAFADTGGEQSQMTSLVLTSLAAGAGALLAFFLISLFLARWALRPVERAWAQQQQFVADASHELKTPLTVILANMGIVLSHPGDTVQQQEKWIENTQAEAMRMKQLVDDLLFLAKPDASGVPRLTGTFNLSDAVLGSVLPFESVAFEQGVTLNSDVAPGIDFTGSEGQIKQLAAILLDNACKYAGKDGSVTVRLWVEQEKIRLVVNNTGTPIAPEDQQHIFERFYRADKSRVRSRGGYGLGLAIAKQIVDAHGGKIAVESSETLGTTFLVSLPVKK